MSERFSDSDLTRVLNNDGVGKVVVKKYENAPTTSLEQIREEMGDPPWAVRIVYNKLFGGVLICQNPGEGNRMHYHSDADECWIIMDGEWEWFIEGEGLKRVKKDDIVVVKARTEHYIKCIGDNPGIRFAMTKPDVDHVHVEPKLETENEKV